MKTFMITLGTIALAVVLVAGGVWLGITWAQDRRGFNLMGPGMIGTTWDNAPCNEGWQGHGVPGPGMMGRSWQDMPCDGGYTAPDDGSIASLEEAQEAVESYVSRLGYTDLHVTEVMEFKRNYYAIVAEEDTGIGAMELLVDNSGAVGPEPGPNMMWNAKYGMHRGGRMGMMGGLTDGEMTLSPEEAQDVAQRWLDANRPNRTASEADTFYGYYTLHILNDGQIEGMLSVHGSTGDVWYHSWHGDFVAMVEGHSHD
jgi:hypothetical protein